MGETIVITSGKGGVGKTTAAAQIGTGLAGLGKTVILVDTDIGLRNLDLLLGLENQIVYNLVDVIEERCDLSAALITDPNHPNLRLLAAAQTRDKSAVTPEQMKELTGKLKEEADYCILDCPAGIEQGFQNAAAGADRALLVLTPDTTAVRDADRVKGLLEADGPMPIELLINRIRPELSGMGLPSKEDISELLALPVIGEVPEDAQILLAAHRGEPAAPETPAGRAFGDICRRLTGEEVPFPDLTHPSDTTPENPPRKGFFPKLFHKQKRT